MALADLNRDGALDIVAGTSGACADGITGGSGPGVTPDGVRHDYVCLNDGQKPPSFEKCNPLGDAPARTNAVAVGDLDWDGDLDIATAEWGAPNRIYLNDGTGHFPAEQSRVFGNGIDVTYTVAIGDLNGDGHPDIVAGNFFESSSIYLNDGFGNFPPASSHSLQIGDDYRTRSLALGDVNGDGALDIALGAWDAANSASIVNAVYLNDGLGNFSTDRALMLNPGQPYTMGMDLGDVDGDGMLDVVTAGRYDVIRLATHRDNAGSVVVTDTLRITAERPGNTPAAGAYSTAEVIEDPEVDIPYTLQNGRARLIVAEYSVNGGGQWQPAAPVAGVIPQGSAGVFPWDRSVSGSHGDNVLIRLRAYPNLRPTLNGLPGPYRWPYAVTVTPPFRLRGQQIKVTMEGISDADAGYSRGQGTNEDLSGAMVYLLPNKILTTQNIPLQTQEKSNKIMQAPPPEQQNKHQ